MSLTSIADLIRAMAWPIVALVAAWLFREPIGALLKAVGERATKFSVLQVSVELAAIPEFHLPPAFDQIRDLNASLDVQSSDASTLLFQELQSADGAEFVIIDLGSLSQPRWLTSRLYLFALMLERMRGIRCMVFVVSSEERQRVYIGSALPSAVRWALARRYPWLEQAYAEAYSIAYNWPGFKVLSPHGAVPPDIAQQIVQRFLTNVRAPAPGPVAGADWVEIPGRPYREHARWLDVPRLERTLGSSLFRTTVPASPDIAPTDIALQILRRPAPFVGRVSNDNRFEALVDRGDLLEQLAKDQSKRVAPTGNGREKAQVERALT